MGKAQSRPTAGFASRRTRVLAALALFAVSAVLLAGAGHHWDAGAQVSGGFWMEFDRDLYDGNQTIRLFGSVGHARIDNPTVTIRVSDEITRNMTTSWQVYVDRAGGFELVIPSLSDALYNATVTHESAGSISTTFTIGQPPPEAVLEEAPQEPVPETEDAPPETEGAVPTVQETVPHMRQ